MKKVKFYLEIGIPGVEHECTMTFPDDTDESEIDDWFLVWIRNLFNCGWYVENNEN